MINIKKYYQKNKIRYNYFILGEGLAKFKKILIKLIIETLKFLYIGFVLLTASYLFNFSFNINNYCSFLALFLILDYLPKYYKRFKQ